MRSLTIALTIVLAHTPLFRSAPKEWRSIVPLHSTRQDVERLISQNKIRCNAQACLYDLGTETVFVLYASEPICKKDGPTTSWRVPRDTVIEINIRFKTERQLSDLGFDLTKFERTVDKELPGWVYYNNREDGVEIEGTDKTAIAVNYFQTAKDKKLRCP